MRLRAFAKINLGLKILGERPDGYHEIRTIYQVIALHDRLEVKLTQKPDIRIECPDSSVPSGSRNIVYRACRLWKQARRFSGGVSVMIQKRVPAASGLGGGSSDAAAALLGLERLTGRRLSLASQLQLASQLGSDVSLFIFGGRVLGCGRGEEVYPLEDLPRRHCLVVYPGVGMATEEAYRLADLKLTRRAGGRKVKSFGVWSHFPFAAWGPAENDFEDVVFAKWPELEKLKFQFIRAGAETASLTGSGSALYAIFDSAGKLSRVLQFIPQGWAAFRSRTLSRPEYQELVFET